MNFSKKNQEHFKVTKSWVCKNVVIMAMLLTLPILVWGQKATNFHSILQKKGYANLEVSYITKMKTAVKALDNCSKSKTKCDLTDPIQNKKASAKEQISSVLSGTYPSRSVQKTMAQFEKQLLKSKKFPKKQLEIAFKKHAGYSYTAMSSRMGFYIMSMESLNDDE